MRRPTALLLAWPVLLLVTEPATAQHPGAARTPELALSTSANPFPAGPAALPPRTTVHPVTADHRLPYIVHRFNRDIQSALTPWSWGWTARGFLGGLVAGPVGAGIAFHRAGRSDVAPASSDDYAADLAERIRARRQEAAFVGGMVGTGVFAYALLRALDINALGGGSSEGETGGGSVF